MFILAGDMGCGDFGAFNNGPSDTPALDRLMAESVCLAWHYARGVERGRPDGSYSPSSSS